jgi:hypothetical protein
MSLVVLCCLLMRGTNLECRPILPCLPAVIPPLLDTTLCLDHTVITLVRAPQTRDITDARMCVGGGEVTPPTPRTALGPKMLPPSRGANPCRVRYLERGYWPTLEVCDEEVFTHDISEFPTTNSKPQQHTAMRHQHTMIYCISHLSPSGMGCPPSPPV